MLHNTSRYTGLEISKMLSGDEGNEVGETFSCENDLKYVGPKMTENISRLRGYCCRSQVPTLSLYRL